MQVMFNKNGTIRKVYDETIHRHPENMTVNITQEQANNFRLYRVNVNTKELYLLPTCEQKYIKTVNNVILEMSVEEKAAVDANIAQQELDAVTQEALRKEAEIKASLQEIDISSIRSLREYVASKEDAPQYIKDYETEAVSVRETLIVK